MEPKLLKIEAITINAGTQTRAAINEEAVQEYAEEMKAGAKFPAIVVFYDGTNNLLADGFHRVSAAKRNGATEILADIRQGSRTDAIKFALTANTTNGLRRTSADKRNCVMIVLKEFDTRSNRAVADLCGVSDMLVADVRKEHMPDSGTSVRIAKNGKKYRMKKGVRRAKPAQKKSAAIQVRQMKGWFTKAKPEARGVLVGSIFTAARPVVVKSKTALKRQFGSWLSNRVKEQHTSN